MQISLISLQVASEFYLVGRHASFMGRQTSPSPKIKDVADRASVSIGTVSRVLNDRQDVGSELRERVQLAIRELGYRPDVRAQNFVRGPSRIIGLVMCNGAEFSLDHAYLLLGIEEACAEAGYYLLFTRHRYEAHVKSGDLQLPGVIQAKGLADCLIVIGTNYDNFLNALDDAELSYVTLANHVVGHRSTKCARDQVRYDDSKGFEDATRYLVQMGHKDIWYIGDSSKPWFQLRHVGYAKAMAENSLEPHAHMIAVAEEPFQNGHAAAAFIIEQAWPMTAIIAGSDEMALGAKESLLQHGRVVPRDVSLIGFQYQIDRPTVNHLTCVCVDAVEVGRQLGKTAIRRIESKQKDLPEVIVPTLLVKRGSCRPLRGEEHMVL
jgi:DNA-binding LacI/PurR family transcriptional regulator